jgi:hypothetical protein
VARQPVPLGPKLGSLPAYQWTFIKMFEIDHTALLNPDQPPPEPAKPILASQLLELEKKQRRRFTKQGKDERISTGCGEIDEVLGGGCERGIVVGISAEGVEGLFVCAFFTETEGGMRLLGQSGLRAQTSSGTCLSLNVIDILGSLLPFIVHASLELHVLPIFCLIISREISIFTS